MSSKCRVATANARMCQISSLPLMIKQPNRTGERDLDILSREKNFSFIKTIGRRTADHR